MLLGKKLFILFFFFSLQSFAFTVVIDPGHGGQDVGALRDFFRESKVTLSLSQKIQNLAENQFDENTLKVILTRQKDETLSLQKRVDIAEQSKADLFISLHVNSAPSSQVSGMEFFFKKNEVSIRNSTKNDLLEPTEAIVRSLIDFGQTRQSLQFNQALKKNWTETRSIIKRAPYFVIERTSMPSVLVEVGFISNLSEAKKLMTDDYQNKIAQSVINAIMDYKKTLE